MLHKKMCKALAVLISMLMLSAMSAGTEAFAQGRWEILAKGFDACKIMGYSTHGWEDHYRDVLSGSNYGYWGAISGHNCTNYAAYMAIQNGAKTRVAGNASAWAVNARAAGYRVDNVPAVGAIAHWDSGADSGAYGSSGHVAYVERIYDNYIEISEDNYSGDFDWRRVYKDSGWPSNFLHLADLPQPPAPFTRSYGASRIDTAVEAAKYGWKSAENVVLSNGWSFPDALAGGPLAYMLDAPILLTKGTGKTLESVVLGQILSLGAKNIYILGGESVILPEIETQLVSMGFSVERLFGADRYETAAAIANKMDKLRRRAPDMVFIADGTGFADALSATPIAALKGVPILFTPGNREGFRTVSENYIVENDVRKAVLLGGEIAVGADVYARLSNLGTSPERIFGGDRYATSAEIYKHYANIFSGKTAVLTTGRDFPDALAGGVLAAKLSAPLMIVNGNGSTSEPVKHALSSMTDKDIYVLGGVSAITDAVVQAHIG